MPSVTEVAAAHRAAMAAEESATFSRLLDAYGRAWANVSLELGRITGAIEAATIAGEPVSPSWLYREQRLTNLKASIEAEVTRFARTATVEVVNAQRAALTAGADHAAETVATGLAGTLGDFGAVSTAPLEALVGVLSDGSPVRALFAHLPGHAAQRAEDALVRGVARGLGPRAIAREVRNAMGGNLARALTIARTETNRAYRSAARATFEANAGVLDGWRWTCARQLRTCALCWAMDGTVHPVTATLDSHPNCRCAMVPITKGSPVAPPASEDFAKLTPEQQRAVLGRAKFDAYQSGELRLRDLVGRTEDRRWGTTRHELSLKDARALKGDRLDWRMGTEAPKPTRLRPPTTAAGRAAARDVAPYRAMARREAGRVVDDADRVLERLEGGQLKKPPPRTSVVDRLRGRVSRSEAGGEWDWFYQLDPAEQKRLRRFWAGGADTALGPDELTDLIAQRVGISDPAEAMDYWLDLTRRHEAAKAVQLGKLPSEAAYGGLDANTLLPEMSEEGFDLTRLFDTDAEAAARHVAEVNQQMAGVEAARSLPRITQGPTPWTMPADEYVAELDRVEQAMADVAPTGGDEWGATYSPEDTARLARYNELWPDALEDPGENLTAEAMHERMVELASRAGLL